ncbi:lipoprotein-anchoring transpeptidase ErfK/SrfK [Kribbella aluminosa]|uniref:Lipoprotein-anchoring transpeptidase ErfK/SrfK n=1 Tax=Kribbella aluminosa TaxID=416017 RepID=A0ABS4UZB0_9ACTN|nr:Ig-like domain-containing protein [Kribbella aluminosa]MBP2356982.1 lipoprotein-anchoring transpeptidase ErfK/SrfK [Kribbella aluminosa]
MRKYGLAVAGICVLLLAGTACGDTKANGSGGQSTPGASTSQSSTPGASSTPGTSTTPSNSPAASIAVVPAKGATSVQPDKPVTVTSTGGKLTAITLKDDNGDKVTGNFNADKTQWTSADLLMPGATYTLSGSAEGTDGATVPVSSSFKTLKANRTLKSAIAPLNNDTVGVGYPVQIYWTNPVKDRAAVEKRLSVKTSVPVDGTWHWVNSTQVNYRPKNYWPVGTKVTVKVDLQGVNAGNNTWGVSNRTVDFTIGKSVVSHVDVKKHVMTVTINGKLARTIPITAGKDGFTTRSGVKLIMEKFTTKRMDAATVGIKPGDPNYYNIPDVKWAQRVTSSGEFIHGAPWSAGSQGSANVSHGCVGMSLNDAQWYFGQTLVGDPVTVTGTSRTMEPGNGWTDWNTTWAAYKSGSALS